MYYLLIWVGVFLFVFLTVVATIQSQKKDRNLQYQIITGNDDAPLKRREKTSQPEFLVRMENLARGAGLQIGGVEVILIMLICAGIGFVILKTLFNNSVVGSVAIVVGLYIPVFYLKEKAKKRGRNMILQLAEAASKMANLLRTGATLSQAMVVCADDTVTEPLGPVLAQMKDKILRNKSALRVFEEAIPDIPISEYKTLCIVADIHSQLGGDMAASFDEVSTTLKDLHDQQQNLHTQTTVSRLSGMIVGITPLGVVAALQVVSKGTYYNDFLKTFSGQLIVIASLLSILYGWWRIYKMSQFKLD